MTEQLDPTTKRMAEAEARNLGIETGMIMAGAMVHMELLSRLGPVFGMMAVSPYLEIFSESFVSTLTKASQSGVEGLNERSKMAYQLGQVHLEMCKRATDYAIKHRNRGNEKTVTTLNHMIEVAKFCGKAADALYLPIKNNLETLVEDGRRLAAVQKMQLQHAAEAKLEEVAHHDCGDPHCPVHTKN